MRILHVFDHSLPVQTGYVFRSLGILAAQRDFGWETVQVTGARHHVWNGPTETIDGWTFQYTPRPEGVIAGLPIGREAAEMRALRNRLTEVIASARPDIVHAHSPVLVGWPALRAARRAGLPFVYEVRALWEDAAVDLRQASEHGLRYRATRAFEGHVLGRADAVVTLCAAMRDELAGRGIPDAKLTVVPNAVDPAMLAPARAKDPALIAQLGLGDRVVLGFIGSFYHYEGLDLLLDALPAIRARDPRIVVLLVGGGPMDASLRATVAERRLDDCIRFTGRVPHGEVKRYYDLVDFLVFPRRRMRLTELVTPLKPVEAMAEGRIVIASDVGGHREMITDDVTGFLFRADDVDALGRRVLEAVGATEAHPAMREAGRRYVAAERVWPVSAANYRAVYERLLSRRANIRSR